VEGCLFGNGERAGNVCLVTLGLNLLTQGIDPGIDFSDLNGVRRTVEHCNQIPVHPRHPYGGELVYTAFSGSHQDAIRKGFDELRRAAARTGTPPAELPWRIPYLPVDPEDVGRTYEAIVRLNSQSGKGGVGYVLASRFGLRPPRELLAEFARTVQAQSDATGGEVTPDELRQLFLETYAPRPWPSLPVTLDGGVAAITLHVDGLRHDLVGQRAGEVERMVRRLADWGIDVCAVHHCGDGSGAGIAVYAECQLETRTVWGVGLDQDAAVAAFAAVRSANTRMVGGNPSRPRSSLFEHDITAVGG
jgi:2-isopropylmalate synthase